MNDSSPLVRELHELVKKWVDIKVVKNWVANLPEKQIRKGINYTLNQLKAGKPIKNIAGYLQTVVRTKDLKDAVQERKSEVIANKIKLKEADLRIAGFKEKLKRLMRELQTKENALVQAIFLQFPEAENEMIEKARRRTFSGYDDSKSVEDNKKSSIFSAALRNTILETYPSRFKALHQQYLPEIEATKKLI